MVLEIVTPEAVLYKGKVSVVTLPGAKGSFQILENHAPIVSLLEKALFLSGKVKLLLSVCKNALLKKKENTPYL